MFAADAEQQSALPEAEWFSVAAYPTASWRATALRHLGGDRYRASGTLSLRGVSSPPLLYPVDRQARSDDIGTGGV
ncbi:YceI family protein [Sphingomonas sp. AP4-R1]|uniref:YceI family protein n=1 Tax=Sphingomonas sp. AP4-R1 TaxID=2735134 RepID=UPI0034621FB2